MKIQAESSCLQYWREFGVSIHTGSCMKITVFWEETLVNAVLGSTPQIGSALTMSNLAQLLDSYIHTGKQHHTMAEHKPANGTRRRGKERTLWELKNTLNCHTYLSFLFFKYFFFRFKLFLTSRNKKKTLLQSTVKKWTKISWIVYNNYNNIIYMILTLFGMLAGR
jgi:hypothetical protein